jgi:hypothetical protein
MKYIFFLLFSFSFLTSMAQDKNSKQPAPDKSKDVIVVEASCGQCKFGLKGKGCSLAVRLDGKAYFVDGTDIDSHGDAHDKDGFCNAIRQAKVQGQVVDGRFKATYFELLPAVAPAKAKQ